MKLFSSALTLNLEDMETQSQGGSCSDLPPAPWPKGIGFLLAHKGRQIRSRQRLRNVTASLRNPALYQTHPFSPV
ncbi:hypothetical protein AOLI_G00051570 [Acnodon oligacanthus]